MLCLYHQLTVSNTVLIHSMNLKLSFTSLCETVKDQACGLQMTVDDDDDDQKSGYHFFLNTV